MELEREEEGSKPAFIVAVVFLVLAAIAILTTYVKGYAPKAGQGVVQTTK